MEIPFPINISFTFLLQFETIGGGVYMLVSGVPVKIDEHAKEMASMALSMLDKIKTIVNPFTNNPLELQIGENLTMFYHLILWSFKYLFRFALHQQCRKFEVMYERMTAVLFLR